MTEFWEASFRNYQEMWGSEPADVAIATAALFKDLQLKKILIPGFGYGRNAQVFIENGMQVTGIEISKTAIDIAKKQYGTSIKIQHGSVGSMPFDQEVYDGVFCYALIHLLNAEERIKLIDDCYNQLCTNGYMVFVALSKTDNRYGIGKEIAQDTFETRHGVTLFFYDPDSIEAEFGNYNLIEAKEIDEPDKNSGKHSQKFWQILCKKSKEEYGAGHLTQ